MFRHIAVQECLSFLNDIPRNAWYREQIKKTVKNKTVLEIGPGAGILAAYCLEAGAKHYIGIDVRKQRADYTTAVLNKMGYAGRFTILAKDFLRVMPEDLNMDVDVLICEQTTDQLLIGFNICDFWNHANSILGDYISLPNQWNLDISVYDSIISSDMLEYRPYTLLNDQSLPEGYYDAVCSLEQIQPVFSMKNALTITPKTADLPIEFGLDLTSFNRATIVFSTGISFNKSRCTSISAISDWSAVPVALNIHDAKNVNKIKWDSNIKKGPFQNGFWAYE